ncbi:MAG: uncharacterized protein JWO55_658 [Candidatus Saccharibacteria bacterium]|jgi:hypothetical protein|nr:uncharacterized protein [Candidatus Saccharibacteria bacterium]
MKREHKVRRTIVAIIVFIIAAVIIASHPNLQQPTVSPPKAPTSTITTEASGDAAETLYKLAVKGRAPKTGYERAQFGDGWEMQQGCDVRNIILHRDLINVQTDVDGCKIISGQLNDPYTGKQVAFLRGKTTSDDVQIDHVIALSNAWQTGAQALTAEQRQAFANDPLELLAVDGPTNQQKSDGDAATWLPPNKAFRCQYVARQIAVKAKYQLWVTAAEKDAMMRVLHACPGQALPSI